MGSTILLCCNILASSTECLLLVQSSGYNFCFPSEFLPCPTSLMLRIHWSCSLPKSKAWSLAKPLMSRTESNFLSNRSSTALSWWSARLSRYQSRGSPSLRHSVDIWILPISVSSATGGSICVSIIICTVHYLLGDGQVCERVDMHLLF